MIKSQSHRFQTINRIFTLRRSLNGLSKQTKSEYEIPESGLFNAVVGLAIDFQSSASRHERSTIHHQSGPAMSVGQRGTSIDIGLLKTLMNDHCPSFAGFEQQVGSKMSHYFGLLGQKK